MNHLCFNHIDVRFTGKNDDDGHLVCTVCGKTYTGQELAEDFAAFNAQPEEIEVAA